MASLPLKRSGGFPETINRSVSVEENEGTPAPKPTGAQDSLRVSVPGARGLLLISMKYGI